MSAGEPRLDLAVLGVDRDDLGGAEIFGAEDRAAQLRRVVEADMLRADAEDEIALGAILARSPGRRCRRR